MTRRNVLYCALGALKTRAAPRSLRFDEVRRIPAPEAVQAVAADRAFLYAIGNHVIGKYDKLTGQRVRLWECERGKPLIHLDSGVVYGATLYCAHSNYPGVPMVSSIETWDAGTLQHRGTFSFGIVSGSATWIDFRGPFRYVTFAHYRGAGDEPDRDPRWTTLVEFDTQWRRRQAWVYPDEVVSRLGQMSVSGGVFAPDGRLLCTGHDAPEIYVLSFPKGGSALVLDQIIPTTIHGQGIALDPSAATILYGIDRARREIVVASLRPAQNVR